MFLKYNLPTLLWAIVILFLTLLPTATLPQVPTWKLISIYTLSHAIVFFVLAVLMLWGFVKQTASSYLQRQAGWLTLIFSVLFGATIELLQTIMELGRQGDVMDIVSNSIGTVVGIYVFFKVYRLVFN